MRRVPAYLCFLMTLVLVSPSLAGPEDGGLDSLVEGLLKLDAPARDWKVVSERSQESRPKVDPLVQLRRWIERKPEGVARYLSHVEPDASAIRDVARLADSDTEKKRFGEEWHKAVNGWLATWRRRVLSEYRGELVEAARGLHYGKYDIKGEADLDALADADWDLAKSVLEDLRRKRDARIRSFATTYLYTRTTGDRQAPLRAELKRMAVTRGAPGYARQLALTALRESEWPGRDEWFLSLFEDPTLLELLDGNMLYRPLNSFVWGDADRWIPRVARMVGGPSRVAHDNAVTALVQFHLEHTRADALKPLLPWLADPSWSSARDRLRLLQSLGDLDMPESIPGLLAVIEKENGWPLRAAASAIERYRVPEAVPVLLKALFRAEEDVQRYVYSALRACGGLDLEARVAARVAYALRLEGEEARSKDALGPASESARLGGFLKERGRPPMQVAAALLVQAKAFEATKPVAATHLRAWVGPWPRVHPYEVLLQQLRDGSVDPKKLAKELRWDRKHIVKRFGENVSALVKEGGTPGGCAAVMLGDAEIITSILSGQDRAAQMGLLACARLLRLEIELPLVMSLFEAKHVGLCLVADAYLLAIDTPEARTAVLARHPGEALVVGAAGYNTAEWEERLRKEVLEAGGPREVIALLSFGAWGPAGQVVLRVNADKATLSFHHRGRDEREKDLSAGRLEEVLSYLKDIDAHTLPAYQPSICDGVHYTFVRLTRDGGYRIYMNNPGSFPGLEETEDVYARLTRFMRSRIWREE